MNDSPESSPEPAPPRSFADTAGDLERVMRDVSGRFTRLAAQSRFLQQLDREILAAAENATPVLQNIVQNLPHLVGVDYVNIILLKEGKLIVVQSSDPRWEGFELPLATSLCGQVLRNNQDLHVPDVGKYEPEGYYRFHATTHGEILLRICDQDGRALGVLTMERSSADGFDEEEMEFARTVAGQIAIAVQHSKLMAGVERLHHLTLDLLVGRSAPETAYQKILEATLDVLECPYGQVLLRVGDQLLLIASSQPADVQLVVGPKESVCSYYLLVENGREPLMINDIHHTPYAPYYLPFNIDGTRAEMQSEMILPILEEERVIGCINLESPDVAAFSQFHHRVVETAGAMIQRAFASSLTRAVAPGLNVDGAQRALEQLGYVASSLLHTFNNALVHALVGLRRVLELDELRVLKTSFRTAPTVAEVLNEEIEYLVKAQRLVADLRERFNPDDPSLLLSKRDVVADLNTVVDEFRTRRAGKLGLEVVTKWDVPERRRFSAVGISCLASAELLEVFENLVDNAADAIEDRKDGDPAHVGRIEVVLDLPSPFTLRVRVRDNGSGVTPNNREKIFDYRFTTKSPKAGARGVGLWFCQHYLQHLGGGIELSPDVADGTEFVLTLPTLLS
jgi:signal transduction histidine kinase